MLRPSRSAVKAATTVAQYATAAPAATSVKTCFNVKADRLEFPDNNQTVFLGTDSLKALVGSLKEHGYKRPLLVSDRGIEKVGVLNTVAQELKAAGFEPTIFADTQPNPSVKDVVGIATAFQDGRCDMTVGLGGGGPLDAAKAGMLMIAVEKTKKKGFSIKNDTGDFITNDVRPFLRGASSELDFVLPDIVAIPTTAGTGSEGGKSAVITNLHGAKVVFGHPALMPKLVALAPQLTAKLPPLLTAATGIDALYHCIEAFFVTKEAAINDGLSESQIVRTDAFAMAGVRLVLQNLQKAFTNGDDMQARLNMLVAALYGAKAFRKGDLGSIHATAHSVGAKYHLHHGTCIAKMAVPVLRFNEVRFAAPQLKQAEELMSVYLENKFDGKTLSEVSEKFLRLFNIPLGVADVKPTDSDLAELAELASKDVCGTNPVPVTKADYLNIFKDAASMK